MKGKIAKNLFADLKVKGNIFLPVLGCHKFSGNQVTVTDLETTITRTIPGEDFGKWVADMSDVARTIRVSDDVDLHEDGVFVGGVNLKPYRFDCDDYPPIPDTPEHYGTITATEIQAWASLNFAIHRDITRPNINGLYLKANNYSDAVVVATDTHRLVKKTLTGWFNMDGEMIIPVKHLLRLAKKWKGDVSIYVDPVPEEELQENERTFFLLNTRYDQTDLMRKRARGAVYRNVRFQGLTLDGCIDTITIRLMDAVFPEYDAVIPNKKASTITFLKDDLVFALSKLAPFVDKDTKAISIRNNKTIRCYLDGTVMKIDFDGDMKMDAIGFNLFFLKESIKNLPGNFVNMDFYPSYLDETKASPSHGVVLWSDAATEYTSLLMPVVIDN